MSPDPTRPQATLAELQHWLMERVTGSAESLDSAACPPLRPSPRLSGEACLQIYVEGYNARLYECIAEDFPAFKYALELTWPADALGICGNDPEQRFAQLLTGFCAQHAPTEISLNHYGRFFPAFCSKSGLPRVLLELAVFEWSLVQAMHVCAHGELDPAAFNGVQAADWAHAKLTPNPALFTHANHYPIVEFYTAYTQNQKPALPAAAAELSAVCRKGFNIGFFRVPPPFARAFTQLCAGVEFSQALQLDAAETHDTAELSAALSQAFAEWVQRGAFSKIDFG